MLGIQSKSTRQKVQLAAAVVILIVAVIVAWRYTTRPTAERLSAERVYKCIECGHDFEYTLSIGDKEPFKCPKCGKLAGYKAEACYWTKAPDGSWKAKLTPTYVVLKVRIDPNDTSETICPDCGRRVVGHNPRPPQELMDAAKAEADGKK